MKGLFIINPVSGSKMLQRRTLRVIDALLRQPEADGIDIFYTHGHGDAFETARALRPGQYDFVCAVGGDGTVSEVASGIYLGGSNCPLAIVAAGTTNDFATSVGLPANKAGIVRMLTALRTVRIDMGRFNDVYFYSEAAGGGLSEVAHSTPADKKARFGYLAYVYCALKKYGNLKLPVTRLTYDIDGVTEEHDTFCFTISNSKRIGGIDRVAPRAAINDGKMDLCIIKGVRPRKVLPLLFAVTRGKHLRHTESIVYRQVSQLRVHTSEAGAGYPLDVDGENGGALPLELEVLPGAISLVVQPDSPDLKGNLAAVKEDADETAPGT